MPADEPPPTPHDSPPLEATLVQPIGALCPGAVVIPGYDLMPEITHGSTGGVYHGHDLTFDYGVSVKGSAAGKNADKFVHEPRVTSRPPHPGIPPAYAPGTPSNGHPFLATRS